MVLGRLGVMCIGRFRWYWRRFGGVGCVLRVLGFNWCWKGGWKVMMEAFLLGRGVLMCFGRFSGYC